MTTLPIVVICVLLFASVRAARRGLRRMRGGLGRPACEERVQP